MSTAGAAVTPVIPSRDRAETVPPRTDGGRAFLLAAIACSVFFVLVRLNPLQLHWRILHQSGAIYLWWPAVVYACLAGYLIEGVRQHRRHGLPMRHPVAATVTALILAAIPLDLLTQWSADRDFLWRLGVTSAACIALACLVAGWIAYTESWRVLRNKHVVACVLHAIESRSFGRYARLGLHARWWGSPHALIIVRGAYQIAKLRLRAAKLPADVDRALRAAVDAGETLLAYLGWRWSGSLSRSWRMRRADVYRELATMSLWASTRGVTVDPRRIDRWMHKMRRTVDPEYRPYVDFLRHVFALPEDRQHMPPRERIQTSIDYYRAIRAERLDFGDRTYDPRRTARDTWIAVAPSRIREEVVLDTWIVMHDHAGDPIDVPPPDEGDPADAWARQSVRCLYSHWKTRVGRRWQELLEARAGLAQRHRANARGPSEKGIVHRVYADTKKTLSWPYLYVWRTPAVQQLAGLSWIVLAALHVVVLLGVVPGIWFNDVEAVADVRPVVDYRDSTLNAIASTESTLGLATSDGLLFFDKASRVVHPDSARGPALDVTRGSGKEELIVLGADQSVRGVTPALLDQDRAWLPPPRNPVWVGNAIAAPQVLRSELDDLGWLVALRGRGIARYEIASTANKGPMRTRSWQQSSLSSIDLRDAIFTDKGAWLVTPGRVDFADRRRLQPVPSRVLERSILRLSADPHGDWAAAHTRGRLLWLYPEASARWQGPFFCDHANALTSLDEVTTARAGSGQAWLGAASGLYQYSVRQRCLATAIRSEDVRQIVPFGGRMLAGTDHGLRAVGGATASIDEGEISDLTTTPQQDAAFYRVRRNDGKGADVRRAHIAGTEGKTTTVLADEGWSDRARPEVLAVRSVNANSLFVVTDGGAFYYNPRRRTYTDCSRAGSSTEAPLVHIRDVENGSRRVLAFGNDKPHAITPGERFWTNLDPEGKSAPVQLAEAGGQPFGIGREGQIYRYGGGGHLLTQHSETFRRRPPPSNVFLTGDLLTSQTEFRMALVSNGIVVEYDSVSAELRDRKGSAPVDVKQVRYTPAGALLALRNNGSVERLGEQRVTIFGSGDLPFPVDQATAIVREDPDRITVGGPGGLLATYHWPSGSWVPRSGEKVVGTIASIERSSAGDLLITTVDGRFYLAGKSNGPHRLENRWRQAYRRVTFAGDRMIGLLADRVTDLSSEQSTSISADVRRILATAAVAWRKDDAIVFVTPAGDLASYLIASDSWTIPDPIGPLTAIQAANDGVYALRGKRLLRIDALARSEEVANYEETHVALRVTGGVARTAYVLEGRALLRGFDETPTLRRGGTGNGLDPQSVVHGAQDGDVLVFLDDHGNIAEYDPRDGVWIRRYTMTVGVGRLVGWSASRKKFGTIYIRGRGKFYSIDAKGNTTPVDELPSGLTTPPRSGVIIDAGGLRAVRSNGVTTFSHEVLGALHAQGNGFAEDLFLSATIAANGDMLALSKAGIIRLRKEGDFLQPVGPPEPGNALPAVPLPGVQGVMATMNVADNVVRWVRRPGRGIQPEWEKPSNVPLIGWCGALAWQCIDDLAVSQQRELLLSTAAGLAVRDPATYALRRIDPAFARATIERTPVAGTIVLRTQKGSFVWRGAAVPPEPLRSGVAFAETIPMHGWRWRIVGRQLTITAAGGRRISSEWISPGRWKLADDVVRSIHRTDSQIVFKTAGKPWIFGTRREAEFRGTLPGDRSERRTSAITITAADGKVTLRPFDGPDAPAIVNGRMFFDNATQIAGRGDALYTYVPGRAVLRRDASQPQRLLQAWHAPPASSSALLDATDSGVRIKEAGDSALVLDPATEQWPRRPVSASEETVTAEGISWRGERGRGARFSPYHRTAPLAGWWNADRFAWDRIHSVAALTSDTVVFASAAGTWVGRLGPAGWTTVAWRPDVPAVRAATALQNGVRRGVVVADRSGVEHLVSATRAGVILQRWLGPSSLFERAVAHLGFVNGRLDVTESWDTSNAGPAARAELGHGLGTIIDSQFDFDAHRSAAPAKGSWWISGCSRSGCFLTRNVIKNGALALEGIVPADCALDHLRFGASGITGVCSAGDGVRPSIARRLDWRSPQVTEYPFSAVAGSMRVGRRIAFSAQTLTWRDLGAQMPWSADPLVVEPSDFRLLITTPAGVALSFDTFTSIALDRRTGVMEIGTRGGMIRWPWKSPGEEFLRYGAYREVLDARAGDIVRLRRCSSGNLWARTAEGPIVLTTPSAPGDAPRRHSWPPECTSAGSFTVNLDSIGVLTRLGAQVRSNNAWHLGDRNITGIVDFELDGDVLWIGTARNGVFKVQIE